MDTDKPAIAHVTERVAPSLTGLSVSKAIGFDMHPFPATSHEGSQDGSPSPDMAEGASFALYSCIGRHM
jgi:hypothetical protein